jgi:hypothetical protein
MPGLTSADIDEQEWDVLAGDRAFAGHRWLRLIEAVRPDLQPRHRLVWRDGRLVAAAIGTVGHRLQSPRLDATAGMVLRKWPVLHVGNPVTSTDGLLAGDTDLGVLLHELQRGRYSFRLVDHLPPQHPMWQLGPGYQPLGWPPVAYLDVTVATFEQFLAELPRKKRQEIRRGQRHAESEGIVVKRLSVTDDEGPRLDELVANVLDRHQETYRYVPGLFGKAAAILGEDLIVLGTYRHGELVGCVGLLRDHGELTAKWIGRDYAQTDGTTAYHALVTELVRTAITVGARRLHLGASAQETKKQFGVEWESRGRLFASCSRAANWIVGKLRSRGDS